MPFNYNNLWKILIEKNISKDELRNNIKASQTTIVKMGRNENISLDIIDRICDYLKCTPNDIMKYIPEKEPENIIFPKRGEIYFANLNNDDINNTKARPVLIIQNELYNDMTNKVFIIPFSSMIKFANPLSILVEPSQENNLPMEASISLINIIQIRKFSLIQKIGILEKKYMKSVNKFCGDMLGI